MTALIYKLWNDSDSSKVYIGSTKQSLSLRLAQHRIDSKRRNAASAQIINGSGNIIIDLLEECPIDIRYIRERYWMDLHTENINIVVPLRTRHEWKTQRVACCICGKLYSRSYVKDHEKWYH
jgi:hypothetical protein